MFHNKPITLAGINGLLASPILVPIFSIITFIRWNYIADQIFTAQYWIFLFHGCIIIGVVINILLIIVFTMMSPIYACCFFPFRIIFNLLYQYIFFGKKTNINICMISIICVSSTILGIVGKYNLLKQKMKRIQ